MVKKPSKQHVFWALLILILILLVALASATQVMSQPDNPNPPVRSVKLVFIHHSCGENWLSDDSGSLGERLGENNYFVSDTNYGWGPDSIGDNTDIGHWWTWFRGSNSATYTQSLFQTTERNASYSRPVADPGGENTIILFKSCYPNSHLGGKPADLPATGNNPLREQDAWSEHMTIGNAKGIYNDILAYFATRPDKLFVAITAPPLAADETDSSNAANARAFNDWLVNDWLATYPHQNVAVFDFYNVLTSHGGSVHVNDAGRAEGNHHRRWDGSIQHSQTLNSNVAAYADGDSHPTAAGNQKATDEFAPLLNAFFHRWQDGEPDTTPTATTTSTTTTKAPSSGFYLPMIWKK